MEPEVSQLTDLNVELAMADLLLSRKTTRSEAAERLGKLANEHPESADVQESLGYLAWEDGDSAKARECFKLAFDKGSKSPEMLMNYGQLLQQSGAPFDQVLSPIHRSVELKPDYQDGWFTLGMMETMGNRPGAALQAFSHLKSVSPERAYALFSAEAHCYSQMKVPDEARALAEKAKPYAKTPEEQMQISSLLTYLDRVQRNGSELESPAIDRSPVASGASDKAATQTDTDDGSSILTRAKRQLPRDVPSIRWPGDIQHVESVVKSFECGTKAPRLHVMVSSKEMVFELEDPKAVVVRNTTGSFEMQCGPQKPLNLGIFYQPSTQKGVDGSIRELVF